MAHSTVIYNPGKRLSSKALNMLGNPQVGLRKCCRLVDTSGKTVENQCFGALQITKPVWGCGDISPQAMCWGG